MFRHKAVLRRADHHRAGRTATHMAAPGRPPCPDALPASWLLVARGLGRARSLRAVVVGLGSRRRADWGSHIEAAFEALQDTLAAADSIPAAVALGSRQEAAAGDSLAAAEAGILQAAAEGSQDTAAAAVEDSQGAAAVDNQAAAMVGIRQAAVGLDSRQVAFEEDILVVAEEGSPRADPMDRQLSQGRASQWLEAVRRVADWADWNPYLFLRLINIL